MTQMTNYAENKVIDFIRGQGLTLPASWYIALGSAASDSSFTELAGTGYARVTVTRSLANFAGTQAPGTTLASNGTSHASSNNNAISWGNPGGSWGTANFVGFFDASSGGNCWFWFAITPIVITIGSPNPVQIDAGALEFSLGVSGGMTDYLANKLIDKLWRAQAFSWPATIYGGLFTVAPTSAGGGTEVAGGAYARRSIVPGLTTLASTQGNTAASSGTAGRTYNLASLTYPVPTADWGAIVAEGLFDASTTGNLLFGKTLTTPKSVVNGGPAPTHSVNSLGITLD